MALILTSCVGNSGSIKYEKAVEHSKAHFSSSEVLNKYASVKYVRDFDEVTTYAKEVEGNQEQTVKNKAALELIRLNFSGINDKENTVVLDDISISEFFADETFLHEFNQLYSTTDVLPTYSLAGISLKGDSTYSKVLDQTMLTALGAQDGAAAVNSKFETNKEGCLKITNGSVAVVVDMDGDKDPDIQYTALLKVSFTWNLK